MRILPIETSDGWLRHLVLPRLHDRIRELADAPADVLAIMVIFSLAGFFRILEGSGYARMVLLVYERSVISTQSLLVQKWRELLLC